MIESNETSEEILDIEFSTDYNERFEKLEDKNRQHYVSLIKKYLSVYLYKGSPSIKSEDIKYFFRLSDEDLHILKIIHFLMNERVTCLFDKMPYLLRNLAHSTQREEIECKGVIRGSINWGKTIKSRYTQGNDDSLFVCSPPLKHYNLEENQLLKFLLRNIVYYFEKYLSSIVDSSESNFDYSKITSDEDWGKIVDNIYLRSLFALRNVYFNEIDDVEFISPNALEKAFSQRNPIYHEVAEVFELYEKLFIFDDQETLRDLVQNQLIVASNNDKLFEIFLFFAMISKLEEIGLKEEFKLNLYYANHNCPVESKLKDGTKIKIWYQKVPKPFRKKSLYLDLNKNKEFGFPNAVRRPDFVVEIQKDNQSFFRIIELKNASGEDYLNKSFYKVIGYYKDFEKVNYTEHIPVVLVNWNGSKINEKYKTDVFKREIIIFNKDEFIENISLLIQNINFN